MPDEGHRAAVEAWRRYRYDRLRQPVSWLTLAGLDWLVPGTNRVPGGEIAVLPGGVLARGADAHPFRHAGSPVTELRLMADADAGDDGPTMLEHGSLRMCIIRRGGRLALRTWDVDAPARASFTGIDHYPVEERWRIPGRLQRADRRTIAVPDVLGDVVAEPSPGAVTFTIDGEKLRLDALEGGGAGELWLIFGDATNGESTYRGGRFLDTDPPTPDGGVSLDFNRAYNPPCVFSPYATCPLPPPQNRLPVRIEAGERSYRGASG